MARFLFPEAFGVVAAALALVLSLILVSDFGVHTVIIQSPKGDQEDFLRSAWVFQLWRGLLLWIILCIVCGIISIPMVRNVIPADSVFANPSFPLITAVIGLSLVTWGAESTAIALNARKLNLKPIVLIDFTCRLLSMAVMFTWAFISPTPWALVAGILAGNTQRLILSHVAMPGPWMALKWEKGHFQYIARLGKWIVLSTMGTFVTQQGDKIILGLLLPGPVFGVYVIAKTLVDSAEALLGRLESSLALPVLSEIARKDPREIRDRYYRFRLPIELAAAVFAGALFVTGDFVVHILYDPRYTQAGLMVRILAVGMAIYPAYVIKNAFVATGDTHVLAGLSLLQAASLILCMILGFVVFGPVGAIVGIAAHRLVPAVATLILASRRDWIRPWLELRIVPAFILGVAIGKAILLTVTALGVTDIRHLWHK